MPSRWNSLLNAPWLHWALAGAGLIVLALLLRAGLNGAALPAAQRSGNKLVLTRTAGALEQYYATYQRWPDRDPAAVMAALLGTAPDGSSSSLAEPLNFLKGLDARDREGVLVDAWDNPLRFTPGSQGSWLVECDGPDGFPGTPDDQRTTAQPQPPAWGPTNAELRKAGKKR